MRRLPPRPGSVPAGTAGTDEEPRHGQALNGSGGARTPSSAGTPSASGRSTPTSAPGQRPLQALPPHPLLAARSNGGSGTTTPTARTNSMPPLQGVAQKKREPGHTTEEAAEEQRRRLEQEEERRKEQVKLLEHPKPRTVCQALKMKLQNRVGSEDGRLRTHALRGAWVPGPTREGSGDY